MIATIAGGPSKDDVGEHSTRAGQGKWEPKPDALGQRIFNLGNQRNDEQPKGDSKHSRTLARLDARVAR
jgi:hypothetical protein